MNEEKKKHRILGEFKEFISRGNVMDLAVGIIIGGAFQQIITSFVDVLVMPLLGLIIGRADMSKWSVTIGAGTHTATLNYGSFLSTVIDFFLMAIVIFLFIKGMNTLAAKTKKEQAQEEEATSKICPFCCSEVPIEATRCPFCTSDLNDK